MPIIFKAGSLNLLEFSGPIQASTGIALPADKYITKGDDRFKSYISSCNCMLKVTNHNENQWRTEGGFGVFKPPLRRNSEGPPKSYQTQPECENC